MTNSQLYTQSLLAAGDLDCYLLGDKILLSGRLTIAEAGLLTSTLMHTLPKKRQVKFEINLDALLFIDSAGVMALYHIRNELGKEGITIELTGGSDSIQKKLDLFSPENIQQPVKPLKEGLFHQVGKKTGSFLSNYIGEFLILSANVFYWSVSDMFRRKVRREGEVVNQAIHIGVNAMLIVVFLSFVIGFVMALQSAGHLQSFGANLFVVDLVIIAVTSQMGPLITGVLVAGRSGSAIAAEIATMKVTSELDALRTMGLDPVRFVVIPKLYACLITMPVLIIMADVSGVIGGAYAAYQYLGITPEVFMNRTAEIMTNKNLITGFVKSQVYATIIVLTGSFFGFRVVRGAEGVGKMTTVAVVVAITLVILADSILMVIFY